MTSFVVLPAGIVAYLTVGAFVYGRIAGADIYGEGETTPAIVALLWPVTMPIWGVYRLLLVVGRKGENARRRAAAAEKAAAENEARGAAIRAEAEHEVSQMESKL